MCGHVPSRVDADKTPAVGMVRPLRFRILWSACQVGDILEQRRCYNFAPVICVLIDITCSVSGKSKVSTFLLKELCFWNLAEVIYTVLRIRCLL